MKAGEVRFQQLLNGKVQYRVPLFQRTYNWTEKERGQLWEDILEMYRLEKPRAHFIGAIVTLPLDSVPEDASRYLLIDGQQRLTTLLLLLSAIRHHALKSDDTSLAEQVRDECLMNKYARVPEERAKLVPTQRDRAAFQSLINDDEPTGQSAISDAWRFFADSISQGDLEENRLDLVRLKACVTDYLDLVSITLAKEDSPHRIFESLNNTGMQLGEADLIRNYLFMRVGDEAQQNALYEKYWYPMQEDLGGYLDGFFWRYLMKDGRMPRRDETYEDFRRTVNESIEKKGMDVAHRLADLQRFAAYYGDMLHPERESCQPLQASLRFFQQWDADVVYPFLLTVYDAMERRVVSVHEACAVVSMLESYLVRRAICGVPTNRLRRVFARMPKTVDEAVFVDSCRSYLQSNQWPDDETFTRSFLTFPMYWWSPSRTRLLLGYLEQSFSHKEPMPVDDKVTIEHVMPQTLNEEWKAMLGPDYQRVWEKWRHTAGNLSLTGYNPDMGNTSFAEKKNTLLESHYELNKSVVACSEWNEAAIRARGEALAQRALKMWARG